jgi:FkbM family methyltransferase
MNRVKKDKYFVSTTIGSNAILLPIYHQLAWTINYNKLYSTNLGRINKYIAKFSNDYLIIDIGANVGDSAFFLREMDNVNKIICVEGNPEYLPLLKQNTENLERIKVIETFVGKAEEVIQGKLVSDGKGTTLIKEGNDGTVIKYMSLEEIIDGETGNNTIRLLKIDTDGYDCPIIKGNMEVIRKYSPVVFFEYAPSCFPNGMDEYFDIFNFLKENEYCYFVFYDGAGNYLISCGEHELDRVSKEMQFYFSSGYKSYGDIAVFHKRDLNLFNYSVNEEKIFYENYFHKKR